MLQLISLNDRQELVASTDSAVVLEKEDRHPVRFLDLATVELNGEKPTIFKIRPLNSREQMSLYELAEMQASSIFKACELAVVSVTGPEQTGLVPAVPPEAISRLLGAMYPDEISSLGSHIITQSMSKPDPLEAADSE